MVENHKQYQLAKLWHKKFSNELSLYILPTDVEPIVSQMEINALESKIKDFEKEIKRYEQSEWPKNSAGAFVCTKKQPKPNDFYSLGRWHHDDIHKKETDKETFIEWKCRGCGHTWVTEIEE